MNNNRTSNNNNNRRRGRGNRPQGGGGGQQLNRIDSRARGNAPQLLEKYRKLAHDAHLNGDRVTAEYYLQFADHYFRVIADARVRVDEGRKVRDERWQEGDERFRDESDESGEFTVESDFPAFDQPPQFNNNPRREREDRPRPLRQAQDDRDRAERPERQDRAERQDRPERQDRSDRFEADATEDSAPEAPAEATAEQAVYEPAENPFVRPSRGLRPRRALREPQGDRESRPRPAQASDDDAPAGLDPSSLPPAIGAARDDTGDAETEAKPRRRPLRRKSAGDDTGEALESLN